MTTQPKPEIRQARALERIADSLEEVVQAFRAPLRAVHDPQAGAAPVKLEEPSTPIRPWSADEEDEVEPLGS